MFEDFHIKIFNFNFGNIFFKDNILIMEENPVNINKHMSRSLEVSYQRVSKIIQTSRSLF